jgi:predicted  nucleic acid-binding Zn-ribbon protein
MAEANAGSEGVTAALSHELSDKDEALRLLKDRQVSLEHELERLNKANHELRSNNEEMMADQVCLSLFSSVYALN